MKYGYFDDGNREYVITRPDTSLPWINYLRSQEYFGLISNTTGRDAPTHGEAKNAWLTGTAAWNYSAMTHCIWGIRPGFSATRHFRGAQYHIQVTRRGPGQTVSLVVDGQPVVGDTLPTAPAGANVHVIATLN